MGIFRYAQNIRSSIVETLGLDLVGPDNAHAFAQELLPDPPSKWYLTGYIIPTTAPVEQREDATQSEQIEAGESETEDTSTPDRAASKNYLPSSIGLTVLVPAGVTSLEVTVEWGDYAWESPTGKPETEITEAGKQTELFHENVLPHQVTNTSGKDGYRRTPRSERVVLTIPQPRQRPQRMLIPGSNGLY